MYFDVLRQQLREDRGLVEDNPVDVSIEEGPATQSLGERRIGLERPAGVLPVLHEDERAIPYGTHVPVRVLPELRGRHVLQQVLRHDGHLAPGVEEVGVGLHAESHGEGVHYLHTTGSLVEVRPVGVVWVPGLRVDGPLERISHVVRVGELTVVPVHILPEVKGDLGVVVCDLPGFGQIGDRPELLVVLDQGHLVDEVLMLRGHLELGDVAIHAIGELADGGDHRRAAEPIVRRNLPLELSHELCDTSHGGIAERDAVTNLRHAPIQAPRQRLCGGATLPTGARSRESGRGYQ